MSQIVSGNTDALAAEYVLGTLDPEERTQAQALLTIDQEFVAKVQLWERRLGELHLMVEPVEPDGKIWDRIKVKMPDIKPVLEIAPAPPEIPQPAPSPEVPEAKSPSLGLDAAPAATKDETPTPVPRPIPNPVPTPASPPSLGPAPNLAASPTPNPAPSSSATPMPSPPPIPAATPPAPASVTPMPSPVEAPKPIAAPVLTPFGRLAPEPEPKKAGSAVVQGRLSRWRAFALLMTLLVLAVAALLAAWRLVPERLPPMLQPAELMRHLGITSTGSPVRRPAPPESQYDE
jgi:hypothetical protein